MANISTKKNNVSITSNKSHAAMKADFVYMNDGVRICSEACSCCWDKADPETYEEKVEYLGKRCKTGHTSILEHSNFVIHIKLDSDLTDGDVRDILDTLCSAKYINGSVVRHDSNNNLHLLIGGSYRGYEELFKLSIDPYNNSVLRAIAGVIYQNLDSKLFYSLCKDNILNEDSFLNVEPDPISKYFNPRPDTPFYESDKIKIFSVDNINIIRNNLLDIIGEDIFTENDISRVATISILFKDMSRTATHQLVRHRNAITQESQRYVDYSDASFADPVFYNPDRYDADTDYTIHFFGQTFTGRLDEIGKQLIGIYNDLREQGMLKEDARAFLPSNVKCRKLYMTFTYKNFLKFLELRCDKAAQSEIRAYAIECRDAFISISNSLIDPFTKSNKSNGPDEIISDKEVILNEIIKNDPELSEENQ